MPELRCRSGIDLDIENTAGTLCERYLPGVLHYLNYWVNDYRVAEELTLKTHI
ncbi:MAG: hypothetical protein PHU23_15825 [Dehalococcoidales bacterium]|nr:hypothetical protein [Dehalococcoidales bacterium]